nr:MAG TPA: hypothetical protein [Caudoviricetes sp.]
MCLYAYGIDCVTFIRYACFNKKASCWGRRPFLEYHCMGVIRKIHIYHITPCRKMQGGMEKCGLKNWKVERLNL